MALAIKVENVGKKYRLGTINRDMLYKDIQSWWAKMRGKPDPNGKISFIHQNRLEKGDEFWALRNINLEIEEGEIVGIIGRNGAGKSTLLKILSQITAPTEGKIHVNGRMASLLEVGTGFHPELTGRENVFLNGAILGMSRKEVSKKFDEIVSFSEVEEFIDTPVKRYSSGMRVKLAFAVAAHLDAEIMVVDEVLAVGDAAFQTKCISKMNTLRNGGRSILFVSHNTGTLVTLCDKGIIMRDGKVYSEKMDISHSINLYLKNLSSSSEELILAERMDREGRGEIQIQEISFLSGNEKIETNIKSGEELIIKLKFQSQENEFKHNLDVRILLHHQDRGLVAKLCSSFTARLYQSNEGLATCRISKIPLEAGLYFLECSIRQNGILQDLVHNAAKIEVLSGDFYKTGRPVAKDSGFLIDYTWN
jgi:lipopolysaccharide transport system ATP-binding protein